MNGGNVHHKAHEYQYQYHYDSEAKSRKPKAPGKRLGSEKEKQQFLIPVGQTASSRTNVALRQLDSRLRGADLYVARLVWQASPKETIANEVDTATAELPSSSMSLLSTASSKTPSTGSLHEELSCLSRTPSAPSRSPALADSSARVPVAVSSHPCYRCVSYMHRAGIRRVFWTNNEGQWESSKVRDMMDLLEGGKDAAMGMFVTKHEVLMLRQHMC